MAGESLAQVWRRRLDEIVRSDLSVERWCELNNTTPRQYGYWRKKLGCEAKQRSRRASWVAVTLAEPQPPEPPSARLTVRIACAEVDVEPGFDPALLRAVVHALGSQTC